MKHFGSVTAAFILSVSAIGTPPANAQRAAQTLMGVVFFGADSDDISPAAAATLDAIATQFKDPKAQGVIARGHSEPTEHAKHGAPYGVGLAQRRAVKVVSYLVEHGVPPGSITSEAFGDSRPLAGTTAAKLRRVEVVFGAGPGW